MNNILTVLKSLPDETRLRIINLLYEKNFVSADLAKLREWLKQKTLNCN